MTANPYLDFLPNERRKAASREPEHSWWNWQGHEVHLAKAPRGEAPVRLLVVHGAGGHSGALWPLAAVLAAEGFEVAAVDLPLFGQTRSPNPAEVRYEHWVALLLALIAAEDDGRPLILFGASIGGMLAYEVAARSPCVDAVAATCLLDPRDRHALQHMTRFGIWGLLGRPLSALVRGPLRGAMVPIGAIADLQKMSRDPALSRLCAADPRGGGARVPLGFLASFLRYRHVRPEQMSTALALVHPAEDAWTPPILSLRVLRRVKAPTRVTMLRECGHFPIEEPGLADLLSALHDLAAAVSTPQQ